MANVINPGSPVEFQIQQADLERQRALAQALQQQSMTPGQGQMISGHYVAPGIGNNILKLAQGLFGKSQNEDLNAKQIDLANKQNQFMGDQATALSAALAANPDDNSAIVKYLNSTGNSGKAADYVVSDAKQQALINQLTGGKRAAPQMAQSAQGNQLPNEAAKMGMEMPSAQPTSMDGGMPSMGAPQPNMPQKTTDQKAYDLLQPHEKDTVLQFYRAGKPEEGIKTMHEMLKTHVTPEGQAVAVRNGVLTPLEGSLDTYTAFQERKKQIENNNSLAPPEYVKNSKGEIVPKTIGQVIGGTGAGAQSGESFQGESLLNQLPQAVRAGMLEDARKSGNPDFKVNYQLPSGKLVSGQVNLGAPGGQAQGQSNVVGQSTVDKNFQEKLGSEMATSLTKGQETAESLRDSIANIHKSRDLINSGAILGAGSNLKVDAAKILNSTFGFNITPDKLTNTDFLRSTLGRGILDKAKTLGANPTDADAARLEGILGSITKDPKSLPLLLDFNEEMARKGIEAHNKKASGINGPYSLTVDMPGKYVPAPINQNPLPISTATPSAAGAPKDVYEEFGLKRK